MARRQRLIVGIAATALVGLSLLFVGVFWGLWREALEAERRDVGQLAQQLGGRAEAVIQDTRELLENLDRLDHPRCSEAHLQAMHEAAARRPHLRSLGHWSATTRLCGVGFVPASGLKPPQADRIYPSGLLAWWPSDYTRVGESALFLLRLGDHDAAIDPQLILREAAIPPERNVALWFEDRLLAVIPPEAELPLPHTLAIGVTFDRERQLVLSRFSHQQLLPVEVVAEEPLRSYWDRHRNLMLWAAAVGLLLSGLWLQAVLRFSRRRLGLAGELRAAIAAGELQTHYQPVIELASGRCIGAEALVRWPRSEGDAIGPDVFVPIAEREGFVSEITRLCLRHVLRDLTPLRRLAPDLTINLNLSPQDLRDARFARELSDLLAPAGLPAEAIKLEITERALVNSDSARALIRGFRERGHQIAIDDFGTGYSSLSYLQSFDIDVLKIDKAFVDAIGTTSATSQVIVHIIEMARSLGLETVAEGVQTEEQQQWLEQYGVRYGQGYLFSPALDLAGFIAFLEAWPRR